jgi:uncharacterized protein (TIGR03435 family)
MILRALLALSTSVARPMGDHLWQSTLFVAMAGILAVALRKNQARVRYWIWLTASVKFLIPFSLLIALGSHLAKPRVSTPAQVVVYSAVEDFSQPFAGQQMPVVYHSAPSADPVSLLHLLPAMVVAVWLVGIFVVLLRWVIGWVRISLMVRKGASVGQGSEVDTLRRLESSLGVHKPTKLVVSRNWMEPGIFGIFRPVLIWPEGISQHLDDRHVEAILAHEICHARRHDNLTAILHMLVEAVFWFHPLVWWIGARLEEERERACDEEISLLCNQPHVYAESILRVCKFCSESPLACVPGITGADLKKRIVQIMTDRVARKLDLRSKLLLLAAAAVVVAAPLALGLARMPVIFGQVLKASGPRPSFEVASIHVWKRPAPPPEVVGDEQVIHQQTMKFSPGNGGGQTSDHVHIIAPLGVLVAQAYGLPPGSDGRGDGRIVGGPDWMTQDDEQYDIQAKIDEQEYTAIQKMTAEQQREQVNLMKQSLLADRFKLKVHFETRELPAYALVVAKGGPKLTAAKEGESTRLSSTRQGPTTEMSATGATPALFAESPLLSGGTGSRTVLDQTGLKGKYDFTLKWRANSGVAGQEPSDEPALFTAIQEQLGLKLVPTKGPVEVIVIDHIEKPTVDGAEVAPIPTLSPLGDKGGAPGSVVAKLLRATSAQIPSNTGGVDFSSYVQRIQSDIARNGALLAPSNASRPPKSGIVAIRFVLLPDGRIGAMKLEQSSGDTDLDKAAWYAITSEGIFPPLPTAFHGPQVELLLKFFYSTEVVEPSASVVPVATAQEKAAGVAPAAAAQLGGAVSAPVLIRSVEPEFTERARQAHASGVVLVNLLVDEEGNPRQVQTLRGLGMGLDQRAIEQSGVAIADGLRREGCLIPATARAFTVTDRGTE